MFMGRPGRSILSSGLASRLGEHGSFWAGQQDSHIPQSAKGLLKVFPLTSDLTWSFIGCLGVLLHLIVLEFPELAFWVLY